MKQSPNNFEVISKKKCEIFFKLCVLLRKSDSNLAYVCIAREFRKGPMETQHYFKEKMLKLTLNGCKGKYSKVYLDLSKERFK